MQVSVETLEGLERKLTIDVPNESVEKAVSKKLQEISKTAKIDGFRPGKAPTSVLKAHYGNAARQEAMGDIIQASYEEAIAETKLRPASMPTVEVSDLSDDKFSYTATIEIYPEVENTKYSGLTIEQEVVNISEEDIDGVIKKLQDQKTSWKDVKRQAKKDDQLTIDFVGSIDGDEFDGGKADAAKVIIGSKSMIPGFETGLKGLKTGEEKTITCTFPKKYQAEHLAGKEASFEIKVINVEAPVVAEIDETFIKEFGVEDGTVETFRSEVKANMQRELDTALKNKNKNMVMDAILESNPLDVPQAMVKEEIKALQENIKQYTQKESTLDDALFTDEASKRVKLGLLVSNIIEEKKVTANADKVTEAIKEIAAPYNDPSQVVEYYNNDAKARKNVEAMVIEEEVMALILAEATVTETVKEYQEVVAPQ